MLTTGDKGRMVDGWQQRKYTTGLYSVISGRKAEVSFLIWLGRGKVSLKALIKLGVN